MTLQEALTETLFQEEKKFHRNANGGRFCLLAMFVGLGATFLATQMSWTHVGGIKFVSARTNPINMAYISTTRGTGTMTQYKNHFGSAFDSSNIPQHGMQELEGAMSYYGSSRYGARPYGYHGYYPSSRYQDYRYRPGGRYLDYRSRYGGYGGYGYGGYGYGGDEVTYGSRGEPHLASFRFRPGASEIYPMNSYGRNYPGYYNMYNFNDRYTDRYNERFYDRSYNMYNRNDRYNDRYGYYPGLARRNWWEGAYR